MSTKNITHAHDAFVRTVMSDLRVARDFFTIHLSQDIRDLIDLNNLVLQPRSYIDDVRKESIVDLLYRTKIDGQEAFLYLLVEHQSRPDELMPFRLLKYTCNVMDHHIKITRQKSLPLVYPMVIYHSDRPYPFSTDIKDLVAAPKELIERYFLKPFQLIDLGDIDDEQLKRHAWVGIMEFVLKHIRARNMLPFLQDIVGEMRVAVQSGGHEFVAIVLQYALERGELENKKAFFELINNQISADMGEKVMTLAEQLRAEGRQEGLQEGILEGKLEVAERLMQERVEISFIAKITGLPLEKLHKLKKETA